MALSSYHVLKALFDTDSAANRQVLADEFSAFIEHNGVYDQARIIDINGDEIVRVNLNESSSEIVASDELQDKADRFYFKEAITLNKGECYVSPLDLNIENGAIEHSRLILLFAWQLQSLIRAAISTVLSFLICEVQS